MFCSELTVIFLFGTNNTLMSLTYNSNFTGYKRSNREFNKTIDDPCAIQQRQNDNDKKLKFVTTNHVDLLEARNKYNFFGIGVRDQLFVPGEQIDQYSNLLNGVDGQMLTNCNVRNGFGQLPISTIPSRYNVAHGDIEKEDSMRNFYQVKKNSCNPRDSKYHERSFYIFDGIESPNALKSVEGNEFGARGGVDTRFKDRCD